MEGGDGGLFLWYCLWEEVVLSCPISQETQIQGATVERWSWDWMDWGLPCFPGLASSWSENLQKVEFLKPSHPHCKAAPCWLLL